MKIAVVTDTASYLTPEQIKKYNITVLPITVILGNKQYKETEELTDEEFYDYLRNESELPTTSQVSMGQIQEAYDRLVDEGYDTIISIHLSLGITSFMDNLRMFVKTYDKAKVYPFDSMAASAAEADLVMLAGSLAQKNVDPEEIVAKLKDLRDSTDIYFAVNDLKHLSRTGRLSNRSAIIGSLLDVKPLLTFKDGKIYAIAKERTMHRAFRMISLEIQKYEEAHPDFKLHITVVDSNNREMLAKWSSDFTAAFPEARVSTSHLGPAISVHTGEKTMGVVWDKDFMDEN
ncbi:DegV family protein [Companilactobacillus halodurans]|uniref:DegV family protein n=1 Tax=Companilactobacillus halodurans TaxID=2584183 RepID=A0A5P0ZP26_9LACO|nr:DegV family protein [Companilactobacillus halodurans]MQS75956.1 DegV family protein [Companilactobacillus halodurans]MQS98170.1 DegV family protein [Companilactobacillus halodurans]